MEIKYKILLVEDVKIAQKFAVMIFEAINCEVDTADTGAQAIELFNKKKYNLIFMDLGLEDMDGLTVTEAIRRMEKIDERVPIIALTAHSEEEMKEKC